MQIFLKKDKMDLWNDSMYHAKLFFNFSHLTITN